MVLQVSIKRSGSQAFHKQAIKYIHCDTHGHSYEQSESQYGLCVGTQCLKASTIAAYNCPIHVYNMDKLFQDCL